MCILQAFTSSMFEGEKGVLRLRLRRIGFGVSNAERNGSLRVLTNIAEHG